MKCVLTIADDSGADIYAIDGCSLIRHWYLNSFGTLSYGDVISELCAQVSWTNCEHEDCVCCLSSDQDVRNYFAGFNMVGKENLANALGSPEGSVLIETRSSFLLADVAGCHSWLKSEIYSSPAAYLTESADRRFKEIGCVESVEGSLPYLNTKRFFVNLIEHMPEDVNVILVPVFASSGSDLLDSDRNFIELLWGEYVGENTLGQGFEEVLKASVPSDMKNADVVLVYNAFIKKRLFV